MKVYVVLSGEKGEGGCIMGVYASKRAARKAAVAVGGHFGPWKESGKDMWESGCDFVMVETHTIE